MNGAPVPTSARSGSEARNDEELFADYRAGDENAFRILVDRHHKPVYRFCFRALGNEDSAFEAAQEVFLRVVKYAPKWERRAKFTTWLYTIARNFCIDEARKGRFRRTESLNAPLSQDADGGAERQDLVEDEGPASDRLTDSARMRQVINRILDELPEEQREVFLLREVSGLSFKDIAQATGAGENTVKSRMRYALVALRQALQAAGFHPPPSSKT